MKFSDHFDSFEFIYSFTAMSLDIDNEPPKELIPNMRALCARVLEPLRLAVGHPLRITSGYRSKELNDVLVRRQGASKNSQHMKGEAADIAVLDHEDALKMFDYIREHLVFDQLGLEKRGATEWIHVSYKLSGNRREVFAWPAERLDQKSD